MRFLSRLLGTLTAGTLASAAPAGAEAVSAARGWIDTASARPGEWREHDGLDLRSGRIFVGDPTWGDDYHIRDPRPLTGTLRVFTRSEPDGANLLIWLEANGNSPTQTGEQIEFGVDAATIGLGDLAAGQALVALGEARQDQGQGDSFEWLMPFLQEQQHFARWLPIPPGDQSIFLVSTGNDGGYAAVWLLDSTGALSGILIDIAGRKPDLKFLDKLLPAASRPQPQPQP